MKQLFLAIGLILNFQAFSQDNCEDGEKILEQKFFPAPFGKKARNIDVSEAEGVVKHIKQFQLNHPNSIVSKIEVLSCTSSVPLPPLSLTDRRENEHLDLAMQRALLLKKELNKHNFKSEVAHRVCGPEFKPLDKNLRFIVKGNSGALYEQAYAEIQKTENLLDQYKEEALIESFDEIKKNYPAPFEAKYRPFQGYRVKITGRIRCAGEKSKVIKSPSGKSQ